MKYVVVNPINELIYHQILRRRGVNVLRCTLSLHEVHEFKLRCPRVKLSRKVGGLRQRRLQISLGVHHFIRIIRRYIKGNEYYSQLLKLANGDERPELQTARKRLETRAGN